MKATTATPETNRQANQEELQETEREGERRRSDNHQKDIVMAFRYCLEDY